MKRYSNIMIAAIIIGIVLLIAACFGAEESEHYNTGRIETDLFQWTEIEDDGSEKEVTIPNAFNDSGKMIIKSVLPQIQNGQSLMIKVNFSKITVKVDGETIYTDGDARFGLIHTGVGNYIAFVPLKAVYSGKGIEIEVYERDVHLPSALKHTTILYQSDYLAAQADKYIMNLVMGALFLLLAVLMFIVWCVFTYKQLHIGNQSKDVFVYASIFLMSLGIWLISDVHLMGIYHNLLTLSGLMNYIAFNLIPVGCMGLTIILYRDSIGSFVWNIIFRLVQLTFIIQCILFLAGIEDFVQMLPVTQLSAIISLISFIAASTIDMLQNPHKEKKVSLFVMSLVSISFVIIIALYLMDKAVITWITLGSLLLGGWVVFKLLYLSYQMISDGIRFEEMRIHAYTDALTGLYNRMAYTEDMEKTQEESNQNQLIIAQIDVNGLKTINDAHGHVAGDELLITVSKCMKSCFEKIGKCYRMGGDEFIIVAYASKEEFELSEKIFQKSLSEYHSENIQELSVSFGKAVREEYPDASVTELEKAADMEMYKAKQLFYAEHHIERRNHH